MKEGGKEKLKILLWLLLFIAIGGLLSQTGWAGVLVPL